MFVSFWRSRWDSSDLPGYDRDALSTSFTFGGADGIRTHDLLDAIEARSQLRHGPTGSIQRC